MEQHIKIDESSHKTVQTLPERCVNALIAVFLGFLLVQLIGFWMFPGVGLYGLYSLTSQSVFSYIGNILNIYIIAFLAFCLVMGWFKGHYFKDRLKGYLDFWKFW